MTFTDTEAANPFRIEIAKNEQEHAYDVLLQVGGLESKQQAQEFADLLAEWLINPEGWIRRQ